MKGAIIHKQCDNHMYIMFGITIQFTQKTRALIRVPILLDQRFVSQLPLKVCYIYYIHFIEHIDAKHPYFFFE